MAATICLFVSFMSINTTQANEPSSFFDSRFVQLSNSENEYDNSKLEQVIEENTIHLVWKEYNSNQNYKVYYRRSTDLGKTWEEAKVIYTASGYLEDNCTKMLSVSGNNVHVAICDYDYPAGGIGFLVYVNSTDNGATFSEPRSLFMNEKGGYNKVENSVIQAVGNNVVIAFMENNNRYTHCVFYMLSSTDGGKNFSTNKMTSVPEKSIFLQDLYFDGSQTIMLLLEHNMYTSYSVRKLYAIVSNDFGATSVTTKISTGYNTESETGENMGTSRNSSISSFADYEPFIAKTDNSIYIVMDGYVADSAYRNTLLVASHDNGKTFEAPISVSSNSDYNYCYPTVIAKDNYVYILAMSGSRYVIYHSSDSGKTFKLNDSFLNGMSGIYPNKQCHLMFDPMDESGKSVFMVGQDFTLVHSSDAFETVDKMFIHGNPQPTYDLGRRMATQLLIDKNGKGHWFVRTALPSSQGREAVNIYYTTINAEPDPEKENKALLIQTDENSNGMMVGIPYSQSLAFDSAMTIELWIKPDECNKHTIIYTNEGKTYCYPNGDKGFSIRLEHPYHLPSGDYDDLFVAGTVSTDKGIVSLKNEKKIVEKGVWHHVAMTYDANGDLNNLKLYVDGVLADQKTQTGKISKMISPFYVTPLNSYDSVTTSIDNVRMWNRALSLEELMAGIDKDIPESTEGLKANYTFNGTFKDISGNGNDIIPLSAGNMVPTVRDLPIPDFELYHSMLEVSATNRSKNAVSYKWDFGDDQGTSLLSNPKYEYKKPGEYNVTLFAQNETTKSSVSKSISIAGIDKVEPSESGNSGFVAMEVYGGGLTIDNTEVILRKEGQADIVSEKVEQTGKGIIRGWMDLSGAALGKWDVVVKKGNSEQKLPEAFTLVKGEDPEPWVSLSGRDKILFNRWQTYTISYGNKSNVAALGMPLNILMSDMPGLEVEFIDFKVEPNSWMKENTPQIVEVMDTLYEVVDDYYGPGQDARFYALYIPNVQPGFSQDLHIRIKSPESMDLEVWTSGLFFLREASTEKSASDWTTGILDDKARLRACVAASAMDAATASGMDLLGMVLPVDCLYDFGTLIWNPWDYIKPEHERSPVVNSFGYGLASAIVSCAADLTPLKAAKIGLKSVSILNNVYKGYVENQDCKRAFDPEYRAKMGIKAVSSFDPNEMVGPAGFGEDGWIQESSTMPYTILFENKSSATAPAHDVFVIDTLDVDSFDFKEFGFSSIGWGDTIIPVNGLNIKDFTKDVDLRPGKNLIVRVAGKLDTLKGIVDWSFLSLNPTTMDLEEDPMIGFLPPNGENHEGEGFVSFTTGVKKLNGKQIFKNKATIVFDANAPIYTNEYVNTFDKDMPQSRIRPIAYAADSVEVCWEGSDASSGIQYYTVYVKKNDGEYEIWQDKTSATCAWLNAERDSIYKIYCVATDNAGITELSGSETAVEYIHVGITNGRLADAIALIPNPAREQVCIRMDRPFVQGQHRLELYDLSGRLYRTMYLRSEELQSGLVIPLDDMQAGQYLLRISGGNTSAVKRLTVINK